MRALAKLMLNSFWGKFGQRNNLAKVTFFKEPAPFFNLICDPSNVVYSVNTINDNMVSVTHTKEDAFAEVMGNTNPILGAYTTSQARLMLYSYIEKLGDRVLYFDTDSVIFKSTLNTSEYQVPIGSYLGDMTNELKDYGPGSYIDTFVGGGPKNYAYKVYSTNDGKYYYHIKVRGFTLSSMVSTKINFHSLLDMVHKLVQENTVLEKTVYFSQIRRLPDSTIVTQDSSKKYKIVYDKRVINMDYSTVPYGY